MSTVPSETTYGESGLSLGVPRSAPSEIHAPHVPLAPAPQEPREGLPAEEILKARRREACEERMAEGVDWPIAFWIGIIHVGVLAAPFYFTWQALAVAAVLGFLCACIGITLGYHRLFTHDSFKTYAPVRWLIALAGTLAGEGSAIHWVANHRKHHALSDQVGDPHSPRDGSWWAHMFWFMWKRTPEDYATYNRRWAPDMVKDPVLRFLDRTFLLWHLLLTAGLYALGYWMGGTHMAISMVVWGMFVRLFCVLHGTWFVNSATHMWGYRNYRTRDDSRNLWWVALISFGEGWHNNHHAYPRSARHGHKWWEVDVTFMVIKTLEKLGLAWDVVDGQHKRKAALAGNADD